MTSPTCAHASLRGGVGWEAPRGRPIDVEKQLLVQGCRHVAPAQRAAQHDVLLRQGASKDDPQRLAERRVLLTVFHRADLCPNQVTIILAVYRRILGLAPQMYT